MEIRVDGRRETLDLQVTLTFQNQQFEGGDLGKAQAGVRSVRPSCLCLLSVTGTRTLCDFRRNHASM